MRLSYSPNCLKKIKTCSLKKGEGRLNYSVTSFQQKLCLMCQFVSPRSGPPILKGKGVLKSKYLLGNKKSGFGISLRVSSLKRSTTGAFANKTGSRYPLPRGSFHNFQQAPTSILYGSDPHWVSLQDVFLADTWLCLHSQATTELI